PPGRGDAPGWGATPGWGDAPGWGDTPGGIDGPGGGGAPAPRRPGILAHRVRRNVAQATVEIAVIGAAPELAIGREAKPEALLQADGILDRAVLGVCERGMIDLAAGEAPPHVEEAGRPQQASDMLGAKGRMGHPFRSPSRCGLEPGDEGWA
ncbi:MAG: hypothetical protein ACJ8EN_06645, partial [Xanthobacteraceae bacterium]